MGGKLGDGNKISRYRAHEVARTFMSMLPGDIVRRWVICGSYRRGKELLGDVELVIQMHHYADWQTPVAESVGRAKNGNPKRHYVIDGVQIDLFIYTEDEYSGAMFCFATGSGDENKRLRVSAIRKGMMLNQYALWRPIPESKFKENNVLFYRKRIRKSDPWDCYEYVAGVDEKSIYAALDEPYKEPEDR